MPGPSPTPDLMDSLGLFTHGEFTRFDFDDPELLLYTHGEFPRPRVGGTGEPSGTADGQGSGGKRRRPFYDPKIVRIKDDVEVISIALFIAEMEDDWDSWF